MKKAIICLSALLSLITGCQHEYKNPFDPRVIISGINSFSAQQENEGIRLTWDVNDDIKTGCRIERWSELQSVSQARKIAVVGLPQLTYLDTTVRTDTTYYYRLIGLSDRNETYQYGIRTVSGKVPFPPPSNLKTLVVSDSSVTLTWGIEKIFDSMFQIERLSPDKNTWTILDTTDVTAYTDTGIAMNRAYRYRVIAFTDRNTSVPSDTANFVLKFSAPSNPHLVTTQNGLRISWTDNSPFETGYLIKFVAEGQTDTTTASLSPNTGHYDLPGLDENTDYTYSISAFTDKYRSEPLAGRLIYVRNFSEEKTLTGQSGEISSLCFFDNDEYLAAGSLGNTVKIWSTDTWNVVNTISGTSGSQVTALGFVPDNDLAIGCLDGSVKVWNVFGWNQTALLNLNNYELHDVLYDASQHLLVAAQYKYLYVWSTESWEYEKTLSQHTGPVNTLAAAPGLNLLASGGEDGIHTWSLDTQAHLGSVSGVSGQIISLCFSPSEDLMACAESDGQLTLLTAGDWTEVKSQTVSDSPADLLFTADNNWLICAGQSLTGWFRDGYTETEILGASQGPFTALASAAGSDRVAAGTANGTVRILTPAGYWDIEQ